MTALWAGAADRRGEPCVARALIALAAVRLSLRLIGFARTLRLVRRVTGQGAPPIGSADRAAAIEQSVARAAAIFPGRALCLEQSLSLYVLLRRAGIDARLRLGVQPYPFGAHAWVECGGEPLNDIREHVSFYVPLPDVLP